MYEGLADFLTELEDARELFRVRAVVDPMMELGEIVARTSAGPDGGPALLFEQVRGSTMPVAANLLGSPRRLCRALGIASLEELSQRIAGLLKPQVPDGWLDSLRLVPRFVELSRLPPQVVKAGACQQVVKVGRDVDLRDLPAVRSWPEESGPTITAGQVITHDPATGTRCVEVAPLEIMGRQSLALHWMPHGATHRHWQQARRAGTSLPVAIVLGGDPALSVAAVTPLPAETDPLLFAGFLRGAGLNLVKCRTHDLLVPADAEIIIEGHLDTGAELEPAGPIALSTGFYGEAGPRPLIGVSAVTQRSNPVFPALLPLRPPSETTWIGQAVERMLLPIVRLFVPEVVDLHRPVDAGDRAILFVSIRKERPQQARQVMHALWGFAPLTPSKLIVVLDKDMDVRNASSVWFHAGAHAHPGRDVVFCEGPTWPGDHAAPVAGLGHKMGIDATRKLPEEGHPRPWPDALTAKPEVRDLVNSRWSEYGL